MKREYDVTKLSDTAALTIKQAGCINAISGCWFNQNSGVSIQKASRWISALKSDATTKAQALAEIKAWKQALTGQVQAEKNRTEQAINVIRRDLAESIKVDRELAKRPAFTVPTNGMQEPWTGTDDRAKAVAEAVKALVVTGPEAAVVTVKQVTVKQNDAPARPVRIDVVNPAPSQTVQKENSGSDPRLETLRRKAALLAAMQSR